MKPNKYPSVPTKVQRSLIRYERRWLPPFSLSSLLGITLFVAFIGSAIRSVLTPIADIAGMGVAFKERMAERNFCQRSFINNVLPNTPWKLSCASLLFKKPFTNSESAFDGDINLSSKRKKYLFMQPYGGLGSRLQATASAMALAAEVGAEPVIVWSDSEFGYTGAWHDLFQAPELPLGCFPGEALRPETATCTVHTVNDRDEWFDIKDKWETVTLNRGLDTTKAAEIDVLCLKSVMYLTERQRQLKGFYRLLQPAQPIQHQIDAFMDAIQWNDSSTAWVGVHLRRTDLKLRCTTENCSQGLDVNEALPLSDFTNLMRQVAQQLAPKDNKTIRFYLATDDPEAEEAIMKQLTHDLETRVALGSSLLLPPLDGSSLNPAVDFSNIAPPAVVSMPKATRDAAKGSFTGWLETRSVVSGIQEAVADLYMLSRAQILIGTVGSTFSQTAKLMGDAFFVTVGAHLELKN
jgi:hypothetical protein